MTLIESPQYAQAVTAMFADPKIFAMYNGLESVATSEMTHDGLTPRSGFMNAANAHYRQIGGTAPTPYIDTVARAMCALRAAEENRFDDYSKLTGWVRD